MVNIEKIRETNNELLGQLLIDEGLFDNMGSAVEEVMSGSLSDRELMEKLVLNQGVLEDVIKTFV